MSTQSSSSSIIQQPNKPRRGRPMEEVWNNITHHQTTSTKRGVILQDFLAGSLLKETPTASSGFHLVAGSNVGGHLQHNETHISPSPFMGTAAASFADTVGSPEPVVFSFCGKKRVPDQKQPLDGSDRRYKRMIKNRESAARSRARKQAYTNELELEVQQMNEENQRLRRKNEEMKMAMAAVPIKNKLFRASTATF